jgi:hypothetical protein
MRHFFLFKHELFPSKAGRGAAGKKQAMLGVTSQLIISQRGPVPLAFQRLDKEMQAASRREGSNAIVHLTRQLLLGTDASFPDESAEDNSDSLVPRSQSLEDESTHCDSNSRKLFHKRLTQLKEGRVRIHNYALIRNLNFMKV